MSSANTFGTFLDTLKSLESKSPPSREWPESEVFAIAKLLVRTGGSAPSKMISSELKFPQGALLGAVVAGRDKGIFEIDETLDEPVLRLTKLGRSLAA